jgi:magnesium transporter
VTADPPASLPPSPLAGDLLDAHTPVLPPAADAAEAVQLLAAAPTRPGYVTVCEGDRIVGLLDATDLLRRDSTASVAELMRPAQVVAGRSESAERVAWLAAHAGADVVAVNDEAGRFLGLVPASRLLGLMVQEHEVDLARLGGVLTGTTQARTAAEEVVLRRIWHRAPWLLVGLAGAVVAAQIVHSFEGELAGRVALAFFLPGIVYMADAVGTQTETLVIRGLSVGVSPRRILRLELLTGALIAALLSLAIFPLALAVTGETSIAAVVSISLLASASCATVVAMSLPFLLQRLRFDPAFGSGPLATVVQDLLSIALYFAVAAAIIGES